MADLDQRQQRELVVAIGRNIVKEIQPKELITYRSYSSLYLEKPEEVLKKQRSSDERTGFGVVETTLLITPYILVILQPVVAFTLNVAQKALEGASADMLKEAIKKLLQGCTPEENHGLSLTSPQLAELHQRIITDGLKNNLPEDQATRIADAVVGNLLPSVR